MASAVEKDLPEALTEPHSGIITSAGSSQASKPAANNGDAFSDMFLTVQVDLEHSGTDQKTCKTSSVHGSSPELQQTPKAQNSQGPNILLDDLIVPLSESDHTATENHAPQGSSDPDKKQQPQTTESSQKTYNLPDEIIVTRNSHKKVG